MCGKLSKKDSKNLEKKNSKLNKTFSINIFSQELEKDHILDAESISPTHDKLLFCGSLFENYWDTKKSLGLEVKTLGLTHLLLFFLYR